VDEVEAKQLLEYIPQKERDSYDAADFAGPDRSFPITTQAQLDAAAHLIGHAADPAAVKRKAIAIAKRKGFKLPASWQKEDGDGDDDDDDGDGKTQESAASVVQAQNKPRKKIATLKVCFLEYNARSLNGRIYPKQTCDAIYQSGLRKLADTNALPMTCFVSHEAANGNINTELVGAVRGLTQEGSKFYATIDLADTRVAWDQLALVEGGYMRSESMRVLGVDLKHDRNYDLPLVVPQETTAEVELMGIDLTTRPGLIDSARILQTLYESQAKEQYTESFALQDVHIEQKEETPMDLRMSGVPLYLRVLINSVNEGLTPDRKAHQRIHDHLAGVLDATVKPIHGSESARLIAAVESELTEEGRAIAKQHAVRLAHAHAEAARQLGMDCESGYHSTLGIALDPDQDGAPDQSNQDTGDEDEEDDGESHQEREKVMTEQEMMEALKAKGFTIEAPKTPEQKLQETIDAAIAEAERKFNEKLNALTESNNNNNNSPQRKTQALNGMNESNNNDLVEEDLYQEGDYLAGKLHPKNWKALANPRVPWPQDVDPALALHELAPLMVHRMLSVEAEARGIEINALVGPYEQL
jgi:hypothetical protein